MDQLMKKRLSFTLSFFFSIVITVVGESGTPPKKLHSRKTIIKDEESIHLQAATGTIEGIGKHYCERAKIGQ